MIEETIDVLAAVPQQGTLRPEIMDGLRWVSTRIPVDGRSRQLKEHPQQRALDGATHGDF